MRSRSNKATVWPTTVTLALSSSPGLTLIRMVCEGAGTSSNQTLETTFPCALQSTSLPICSSALELSRNPPRPTQAEANVGIPGVHTAAGCFQVPLTCLNLIPERWTA